MFFENIGRTIGDIFGLNRKKRPEGQQQPRPQPVQRPAPGFGLGNFNVPTGPARQPQRPSVVGQPIQTADQYFARTGRVAPTGSMLSANPADRVQPGRPSDQTVRDTLMRSIQQKAGGTPRERAIEDVPFSLEKIGQGLARVPETVVRSGAQLVDKGFTGSDQGYSQTGENEGLRRALYGKAPISSYQKQGVEGSQAIKGATGLDIPAPLVGAGAFALDVSLPTIGKAVTSVGKPGVAAAIKAVKPSVGLKQPISLASTPSSAATDRLLQNIGIDTQAGLVKGNALYTNPVTKGYNKGQQAVIEQIDKARDKVAAGLQKGLESENKLTSGAARLPQVAFKNFGQSDVNRQILTARSSKIQSAGNVAKLVQKDLDDAVRATGNPELTNRRIYQVLESPEYLKKVYGDPTKIKVSNLAPAEKVVLDKLVASNKVRNDLNLATGQITKKQHTQFADGFHSPRIYDMEATGIPQKAGRLLDSGASIKRKDITQIDEAITDQALKSPTLASSVRLETALRNKANLEALDDLAKAGLIRSSAPNKNYVKLVGKQYGQWDGAYIDKQIKSQLDGTDYFNSNIGQKASDLVGAYQDTPLGAVDRFQKKIKTVYAPATNIGNIASNILAFSGAANVNSATVAVRMAQAGKQLAQHGKKFNSNVYRAEKAGLFSGDTGKQLLGKNEDVLKTLEKKSKNPLKSVENFYGKTDQAAALGIFNELKARGLSDVQAVRRAHKAVQNYNNAGRGVNLLADSPALGKPFARFTPELLRIAKNNALYNPLGTAGKVGALAAGGAALSSAAGETTEERQAREDTVGQTKLPFTGGINSLVTGGKNTGDISLNIPVGDSAVNIARASGLNFPIEPGGDANSALIRQLSPVADITRTTADGKTEIAPNQLVSSMGLRPLADQLVNRDFMGRQITDPENKVISEIGKGKSQFENADGTRQSPGTEAEIGNRLRALGMNYLPLSNEADVLLAAGTKQKDYYGKERTLPQAALRTVGLKTESNTKDVREKRVNTKEFFEGKDKQVKEFLTKNPEVADAYFKFNDSSRDRFTNKKSSNLVTPEKWSIVKGETTGKLFNQLKQEALDANEKDSKPVDPIYQISDAKRVKDLIGIRSTAPGDDIERQEILRATTNWFKPFEEAERGYYDASKQYYENLPKGKKPADKNDRVKEYSELPYPQQSKLIEGYYQAKAQGTQVGKDYYKANADALSADFSKYKSEKLDNINKKREILGLDPIKPDTFNNVTFGYEDDERKVLNELRAKTGGFGGGGRKGSGLGKSTYAYAVSANAGSKVAKPKVSAIKPTKAITFAKAGAKPKVSIKKALT